MFLIYILVGSNRGGIMREWMGGVEDKEFKFKYVEFKVYVKYLSES